MTAIGIESLNFTTDKTRENRGRQKRFRHLTPVCPPGKLKARQVSMAAEHGLSIVEVDPVYTSMSGAQPGRNRWPPHGERCPVTMPRVSRSDDTPSDTRSGMGYPLLKRS
ncbi:hypothetical protein [Streptomyces sp. NBC_01320]|uniref:hypothetical protein n=1 Tax=Streptomyces sp. NBC_01320 TaxID=2903824 RepID=UPI003FA3C557